MSRKLLVDVSRGQLLLLVDLFDRYIKVQSTWGTQAERAARFREEMNQKVRSKQNWMERPLPDHAHDR